MKECFKCGKKKNKSEFYTNERMADKLLGKCKQCTKTDTAARIEKKKKDPAWLKRERRRCRIKQGHYRKIGMASQTSSKLKMEWRKRNPEKHIAHIKAASAVKQGVIKKPELCQRCNALGNLEKHHEDYSKPLNIEWLCARCHGKTRRK